MNHEISYNRELFAKIISRIFEAPFIAIPVFLILNILLNNNNFLNSEIICLLFGTIIPMLLILIWSKIKKVDKDYTIKEHRNIPLLIISIIYFIGAIILWLLSINPIIISLMFCYGLNTLIVFFINLKWKISVHSMGIAGPITALMFVNPLFFILGFITPIIMWSRLILKKHTLTQVLAGSILGYLLTYVQIYYLTQAMNYTLSVNLYMVLILILFLILFSLIIAKTLFSSKN
ncbi:PAP2 family protein [Methanobrevibacter sp. DSM 116169]|uniref:PAP2 family protein n=1 Tax=Methanobrevibacter sp. DSM 116169 TaxID=3242727 RepID=UPI0038FC47F1